jgi:hypothetical protein
MSTGLAGSLNRRRIDVCDECGEDILDLNDHYTGWILGRRWDLHQECFNKRRLDMDYLQCKISPMILYMDGI